MELNSPACSMRQADDVYMGFAGNVEIVRLLTDLLDAETARNAIACAFDDDSVPMGQGEFCHVLMQHLKQRNAEPGVRMSPLYRRALAASDAQSRRQCIVSDARSLAVRIRAVLARIRDDKLHADLTRMAQVYDG